jgi:hypothetical protein
MRDEDKLKGLKCWAWVGEDDGPVRSGEIGLKQGRTPAGMIPLAAVTPGKMHQGYIRDQMRFLVQHTGVKRYLVRFRVEAIEEVIEPEVQ